MISSNKNLNQLATKLGKYLSDNNIRISAAESCTGGLFGKTITDIPGCSSWFDCSLVTYSNEAKMSFLGVKRATLTDHGAVSEEVVREMAEGVSHRSSTEIGVAVSGIAGPKGGTRLKPVGTVCFGFNYPETTKTFTKFFDGNREEIRTLSTEFLLVQLLVYLTTD
ncbi:MAG: hypothetical protein CBC29_04760 [Methylococcaceae bacterium TMED69]|nr:MAG: hypothetical protein CBC29_04760 [Methylococcaceae bacterium TMED69]|tara:strand:+ start:555 stop:1052 length:498 start_codon:yes stop_codon:yes gene_type:complete